MKNVLTMNQPDRTVWRLWRGWNPYFAWEGGAPMA